MRATSVLPSPTHGRSTSIEDVFAKLPNRILSSDGLHRSSSCSCDNSISPYTASSGPLVVRLNSGRVRNINRPTGSETPPLDSQDTFVLLSGPTADFDGSSLTERDVLPQFCKDSSDRPSQSISSPRLSLNPLCRHGVASLQPGYPEDPKPSSRRATKTIKGIKGPEEQTRKTDYQPSRGCGSDELLPLCDFVKSRALDEESKLVLARQAFIHGYTLLNPHLFLDNGLLEIYPETPSESGQTSRRSKIIETLGYAASLDVSPYSYKAAFHLGTYYIKHYAEHLRTRTGGLSYDTFLGQLYAQEKALLRQSVIYFFDKVRCTELDRGEAWVTDAAIREYELYQAKAEEFIRVVDARDIERGLSLKGSGFMMSMRELPDMRGRPSKSPTQTSYQATPTTGNLLGAGMATLTNGGRSLMRTFFGDPSSLHTSDMSSDSMSQETNSTGTTFRVPCMQDRNRCQSDLLQSLDGEAAETELIYSRFSMDSGTFRKSRRPLGKVFRAGSYLDHEPKRKIRRSTDPPRRRASSGSLSESRRVLERRSSSRWHRTP